MIFAGMFFQINLVWIFMTSSSMWLETAVKEARYTTFDGANVLKIVTFPLIVRLPILYYLIIFWMFPSEVLYYMKSEALIFCL